MQFCRPKTQDKDFFLKAKIDNVYWTATYNNKSIEIYGKRQVDIQYIEKDRNDLSTSNFYITCQKHFRDCLFSDLLHPEGH